MIIATPDMLKAVVLLVGGITSTILMMLSYKFLAANRTEYRLNRDSTGGLWNVLTGRVKRHPDGKRTYRVRAGIAIDTKKNQWIEQGTLSEEAIDSLLS